MRRSTTLLIMAALLLPPPAASAQEQKSKARDVGNTECSAYNLASNGLPLNTHLHARLGQHEFYDTTLRILDWMSGYIVSFKRHAALPAAMVRDDYGSIDTFLRSYCGKSPQANFQSAADAFIQQQLDNTI